MATFSFAEGSAMFDSTPIENMFLMEHLPTAPEACLRVYLYARMLALHPELGSDVAGMAQALRLDEDAVYRAFSYWERQGLVRRLTDRPPTYELLPVRAEGGASDSAMEREYYAYRDFNASLQALFGQGRIIESHEYRLANDWLNVLGYDQDAVLRMVEYGISRTRSKNPSPAGVFKRVDRLAQVWADRGCRSLQDVERAISEEEGVSPIARAVCKRLALRRDPTPDELDCVKRWVNEWGFTEEQILAACEETTKARTPTFAYLDAVLKSRLGDGGDLWKELGEILRELDNPQARPTPDQLKRYEAFLASGFEAQTVKLAAIQCHRNRHTRFEDLEWMLKRWGELGLYARDAAQAYIEQMSVKAARVRRILEACGLERRAKMGDVAMYDAWRERHDEALIDFAASCARGAHQPMQYMDRLLGQWSASGVRTVAEAQAEREAGRAARQAEHAGSRAGGPTPNNPALNYAQREYADGDYGDDFFFDVMKEYGTGGTEA